MRAFICRNLLPLAFNSIAPYAYMPVRHAGGVQMPPSLWAWGDIYPLLPLGSNSVRH